MKSHLKFQPRFDSLEDRLAPASIPITLPPARQSIVITLPTVPPAPPPAPPVPPSPPAPAPIPDDPYENNDSIGSAYDLGTLTGVVNPTATKSLSGLIMNDNADWFKVTTTMAGTAGSGVNIAFNSAAGDLNLRLFDSVTATAPLRMSRGTGNSEAISFDRLPAGTYYIQVHGLAGARNPSYTFGVKQAIVTYTPSVPPNIPPTPTPPPNVPNIPPPPANGFNIVVRSTGLTANQVAIFQQAANRWGQIIIADLPDAVFINGITNIPVDDLLIDASARPIDGLNGVLGQAAPDRFRTGSGLPFHGFMEFDTADLAALEQSGELYYTALHEMGHVLGFGTIWQQKNLILGIGTLNPVFLGPLAAIEYNRIFGTDGSTVPVEATGGPGTANSHWRETVFGNELMTGFIDPGVNPLSRVTAAAMGDLGYTVNIAAADSFTPPPLLAPQTTSGQKPATL